MTTYAYSLAVDFPNGLNEDLLHRQVLDAALGQTLQDVSRAGDVVSVVFAAAITQDALTALVAAHNPTGFSFEAKHSEEEFVGSRVVRRTWYARKVGAVRMYKVEETTYTYSGNTLIGEQMTKFKASGAVDSTTTFGDFTTTDDGSQVITRKGRV